MNTRLQTILIVASILFMLFIIIVTQRKKLSFKYTLLWLLFSLIILILAIFPRTVMLAARLLFIETPTNAIFLIFFVLIIVLIFYISIGFSKLMEKSTVLTQNNALLSKKIEDLEQKLKSEEKGEE